MKKSGMSTQRKTGKAWGVWTLLLLAIPAAATAGDFTYTTNSPDTNTVTITGYTGAGGAVDIPSNIESRAVTVIGENAFWNKGSVTSVTIPATVVQIGDYAFGNCGGLTSVAISASVGSIGFCAFMNCGSLTAINVNAGNAAYSSADGVLFNQDLTTLIQCPGGKAGNYTAPDSVVLIVDGAFSFCTHVTSITIGSQATAIGEQAFNGCSGLTNVVVGQSLSSIGSSAFWNCLALTRIYFWGNAPSLGLFVFDWAYNSTIYYLAGTTNWHSPFGGRPAEPFTPLYILAVHDGAGSGSYTNGASVAITASNAPTGQVFDRWIGATQCVASATSSPTLVTMPASNIDVAATYVSDAGDFSYTTNADNTITITGYAGPGSAVIIPATLDGKSVTCIGNSALNGGSSALASVAFPASVTNFGIGAFWGCGSLAAITVDAGNAFYHSADGILFNKDQTTLIQCPGSKSGSYAIPASVTHIGDTAFNGCTNLTVITIGTNVTFIGDGAFSSCSQLASVTIPDFVTNIGGNAFAWCTNLTSVTIGNSVANIGIGAFSWDSSLESVAIPDSATNIGATAFYGCTNLASATIGNGVASIGAGAFGNCRSLTRMTIPNFVSDIGDEAFYGCASMTNVTIGTFVTHIGIEAFSVCRSLTAITVESGTSAYSSSADGVLFDHSQATLVAYPGGKVGSYTISNGVTRIEDYAFEYCDGLTGVAVPGTVTNIGDHAFGCCSNLTSIALGDGVTRIGELAFTWCTRLASVTIPDSVTDMGAYAFNFCTGLTNVTLSSNLIRIEANSFNNCSSLPGVVIPEGVTNIGESAFAVCTNLASVTIPDSVTRIEADAFWGCSSLSSVEIPDGVIFIGARAFGGCSSLTHVAIPSQVIGIESGAFDGCTSLTYLKISEGVTTISDGAFSGCSSLASVVIPASVASLGSGGAGSRGPHPLSTGNGVFYNCTSLTSVYFLGDAPSAGEEVFEGAESATIYYLPGTTGWPMVPDLWAGRPTALWLPEAKADGSFGVRTNQFGFDIDWADGKTIVVEACTNLTNPDWIPMATNTLTDGTSYFGDSDWTNHAGRFYRLRAP